MTENVTNSNNARTSAEPDTLNDPLRNRGVQDAISQPAYPDPVS